MRPSCANCRRAKPAGGVPARGGRLPARPRAASRSDPAVELGVSRLAGAAARGRRWRPSAVATVRHPTTCRRWRRPVLAHRLILSPESRLRPERRGVIDRLLEQVPVPSRSNGRVSVNPWAWGWPGWRCSPFSCARAAVVAYLLPGAHRRRGAALAARLPGGHLPPPLWQRAPLSRRSTGWTSRSPMPRPLPLAWLRAEDDLPKVLAIEPRLSASHRQGGSGCSTCCRCVGTNG